MQEELNRSADACRDKYRELAPYLEYHSQDDQNAAQRGAGAAAGGGVGNQPQPVVQQQADGPLQMPGGGTGAEGALNGTKEGGAECGEAGPAEDTVAALADRKARGEAGWERGEGGVVE